MCSSSLQAGLFSAVTSTFIAQVQPELQPDPNVETAILLRVLISKVDNSTGDNVPMPPQWSGPPPSAVHVQAILYASLVISLFCAFLAMLGKQWLNRYASIEMRGSAIQRSQHRQRKFDGTANWRFEFVMESLPLMLQGALFLLGCALSLYLWKVDVTIASVVLGVTMFGVFFYTFIVVAGTASESCPYQTPLARILRHFSRHIFPLFPSLLHSAASSIRNGSETVTLVTCCWRELKEYKWLRIDCAFLITLLLMTPIYAVLLPIYFFVLPTVMAYDTCLLALAVIRKISDISHNVRVWFRRVRQSDLKVSALDLRCISWMLRVSMDKVVHLSALKLLATMATLMDLSPALVSSCFDTLIDCFVVDGGNAVVTRESEELAAVSAQCCLRTLSHIAATDATFSTIKRVRKRYTRAFPPRTNFDGLPPDHSLRAIHNIFHSSQPKIQWEGYRLLENDEIVLGRTLAELAKKYTSGTRQNKWDVFLRGRQRTKVPRWILRFAVHRLSQDPPPPTSTVINCLSIIAVDLGCKVDLNPRVPDERYFHLSLNYTLLT